MPTLYPPHPSSKISSHRLGEFESAGGWLVQRKFNGTRVVIHVSKERRITILTRHGTAPKLFSLTDSHRKQILSLSLEEGKEYWFDGELLDHKTKGKGYKGKIVLFDVLQAGEYLIRKMNQKDRLALLSRICGDPSELEPASGIALRVTEDIWLAENWTTDFQKHFAEFIHLDEIEGLVLRKSDSVIDNLGTKQYEVAWIVRCRKPHAGGNYNF